MYTLKQDNILSGLENWTSADAALEGIKRAVTVEIGKEFQRRIVEEKKKL